MYFGFENEDLMGKRVCNITYRQLVNLGAVLPYEVLVLAVNQEDIKNFISSNTWVRDEMFMENEQVQSRFVASIIAADKAFKRGYTKRLLSFHSRNEYAKNFEKTMINLQNSNIFTSFKDLDFIGRCQGGQADVNKSLLDLLSDSNMGIVSNARVLTEGVNTPAIDTVIFCDPKTSAADVAQGISRSIRLMMGKEIARVIIPVITNEEGQIDQPQFKPMIDILDFIASFDEALFEEINIIPQSQGRIRIVSSRIINTNELEIDGFSVEEFYNEVSLTIWNRVKSQNGFWDKESCKEVCVSLNTVIEMQQLYPTVYMKLRANNYAWWDYCAPHIERNVGLTEEECAEICNNFKGSYTEFFKDYRNIVLRFYGLAEMKNETRSAKDFLDQYTSHMERNRIDYKNNNNQFFINLLSQYKSKKEVRENEEPSLVRALKKWPHLKEAFDYYNNLPATSPGLKIGNRRGGGWTKKKYLSS